ncbi:MAG: V-type ATP synthase subunit D [Tenericutes bacterium GWF2_57_13]|nr:MAG: V-type ATP synthase subunit D [Tenericutes bacterium GWF2_57_13]
MMNVNPTRMELSRLKRLLATARRGHKLLKDKQDEMIRRFMDLIRQNRALRIDVEEAIARVMGEFAEAKIKMSRQGILEALMVPAQSAVVEVSEKNVMNVKIPVVHAVDQGPVDLTYGFAFTPALLDRTVLDLAAVAPKLVELAGLEKACDMLADEIEKTRRRVNAIEFIMIPDYVETIHYIQMKLDDAERSNLVRIMKSKEIILNKAQNKITY